jgi:hypothetical protein
MRRESGKEPSINRAFSYEYLKEVTVFHGFQGLALEVPQLKQSLTISALPRTAPNLLRRPLQGKSFAIVRQIYLTHFWRSALGGVCRNQEMRNRR